MSVTLDTRKLDALIVKTPEKASQLIRKTAFKVQQNAMMNIQTKKIIDTGALLNSIRADEDSGPLNWWVHDGVEYGIYNEMGTYKMGARPFLVPAVETERKGWANAWKELLK